MKAAISRKNMFSSAIRLKNQKVNKNPVNLQCVMSQQLEEHFKLGVQACLKGFVKDANIQGNIVIFSKYLLKIDVCCYTYR